MPPFYLGKTILTRNIGYADIQIKGEEAQAAEAAPPPNTKECPYCYSTIPIKATRCPNCTSELKPS
jgi:predicted Zn-ribbon and HTH transcriptional regulator